MTDSNYDLSDSKRRGNAVLGERLSSIRQKIKDKTELNVVSYIYDNSCLLHINLPVTDESGNEIDHQESKYRIAKINGIVFHTGLNNILMMGGSIQVTRSDILKIHNEEYLNHLIEICEANEPCEIELPSSEISITDGESMTAMLAAIGSVKGGINMVCSNAEIDEDTLKQQYSGVGPEFRTNTVRRAFCNVRPPGHHAFPDHGSGFCFLNNIMIGAQYALDNYSHINKILIVDWDLHHGDGSQHITHSSLSDEILYASFHRGPDFYPYTGTTKDNKNKCVLNFPFSANTSIDDYIDKFDNEFLPIAYGYDPDLILISAGFDSHKDDKYHELPLDYSDYEYMTMKLIDLAETTSEGRIVSILEGGYTIDVLMRSVAIHIATMIDYNGEIKVNNQN